MDENLTLLSGSAAILIALTTISYLYDRSITQSPRPKMAPNGITAIRVVVGVLYTLIGGGMAVSLWASLLPAGWLLGPVVAAIMLVCFIASGLPMVIGDMKRTRGDEIVDANVQKTLSALRGRRNG